jgi:hypothetical protein
MYYIDKIYKLIYKREVYRIFFSIMPIRNFIKNLIKFYLKKKFENSKFKQKL